MPVSQSMLRDLLRAFMRRVGFIHRDEIKEGFLSRQEVTKDFQPREEVKAKLDRFIPAPIVVRTLGSTTHGTSIARVWHTEDAQLCKLCPTCSARMLGNSPPGNEFAICMVWAPGKLEWYAVRLYQKPPEPEKPAK